MLIVVYGPPGSGKHDDYGLPAISHICKGDRASTWPPRIDRVRLRLQIHVQMVA
jgi:hypothetical protein